MRVRIDDDRCRGHGMCCSASPKVFDMSPDGFAVTLVTEVPEELQAEVRTAVMQCPEGAISISASSSPEE